MPFNGFSKWVHLCCGACAGRLQAQLAAAKKELANVPDCIRDGKERCCFCAEGVKPEAVVYCFRKIPSEVPCRGKHSGSARPRLQGVQR